jgi:ribosomal-protein-alanine N-acetyltransferase
MLETPRLVLRPVELTDANNLYQLNLDPAVVRYTGDKSFNSLIETQKFILEKMIPQFERTKMSRFMVFLKNGDFLGWCGLKYHAETNEVDLGYRFIQKSWGQGHATEAALRSIEYGFLDLGLDRIIAKSMPENTRSIKVIQKLGMEFKGYVHDPTDPRPFILFELLKKKWHT